ncbi:hypothetical protein BT96DRAFT_54906 [Gymnopus androsaceus JB14]|uniref:Uncharacterized protein n=1 Tax=Gymnopus androsaceus JB14 TaxID=1447944 RepID=A0A6A4IBI7_9AGAR|nr:hypothetical protein BT96DRAFT_54906 [Gymnopus androsaceus JB14]
MSTPVIFAFLHPNSLYLYTAICILGSSGRPGCCLSCCWLQWEPHDALSFHCMYAPPTPPYPFRTSLPHRSNGIAHCMSIPCAMQPYKWECWVNTLPSVVWLLCTPHVPLSASVYIK